MDGISILVEEEELGATAILIVEEIGYNMTIKGDADIVII